MQEINALYLQLDGNTPYYVHDIRYNYKMIVYPNLITENRFGLIVIYTAGHKVNEYGHKPNEEIFPGKGAEEFHKNISLHMNVNFIYHIDEYYKET